jgi:hypothetical protein
MTPKNTKMKKLIYTLSIVSSLAILSSCTKENDVTPVAVSKAMTGDARDKSDVGTADGADSTNARDKSDVGTADAKTMTADARDKSDVGTADLTGEDPRDKSDVGTADMNGN